MLPGSGWISLQEIGLDEYGRFCVSVPRSTGKFIIVWTLGMYGVPLESFSNRSKKWSFWFCLSQGVFK